MTIEELKTCVRTVLSASFPTVTIHIDRIAEDPLDLGVSVFGVDKNAVKWVKDMILDLDEDLCANTEFVLTPLVRDSEITRKFYPQFLSPWTALADIGEFYQPRLLVEPQSENIVFISESLNAAWEPAEHSAIYAYASTIELALAA